MTPQATATVDNCEDEMVALPVPNAFFWLVTAQLVHVMEEYAFKLWTVFPPTVYLSSLVSDSPQLGYLAINGAIVLFGYFCHFKVIAQGSNWTTFVVMFWLFFSIGNGVGHIAFSAALGYNIPGLFSAPLLLIAATVLWYSWKQNKRL